MRLFLYEDITGGGCPEPPSGSLLSEGRAMRDALARDFSQVEGVEVCALHDERLPAPAEDLSQAVQFTAVERNSHRQTFRRLAGEADWSLVIAPEFDDRLWMRCEDVEAVGGRLLGPDSCLVALCSDKFVLLDHLAASGIATPRFARFDSGAPAAFPFPAVLKPRFGAGSLGVSRIESAADLPAPIADHCLEELVAGEPLSVFVLKGAESHFVLPACRQHLGGDSGFQYLGGLTPVSSVWQQRAESLANAVLAALPDFTGQIGLDLVLDTAGDRDVLIEVNPRLTTSYVGLRRLIDRNLAECMLEVAGGGADFVALRKSASPIHGGWSIGRCNTVRAARIAESV